AGGTGDPYAPARPARCDRRARSGAAPPCERRTWCGRGFGSRTQLENMEGAADGVQAAAPQLKPAQTELGDFKARRFPGSLIVRHNSRKVGNFSVWNCAKTTT